MRIVFMGSPDFAVPSLEILIQNNFEIAAVITATDKIGGRGKKQLLESEVKKYAISKGLKVLQPKNLKSADFNSELHSLNADLFVVVAFRMLPEMVWSMPKLGTINLHASLLPAYRGAAPINWAIAKGETVTGATTFFINKDIDTGSILMQKEVMIDADETAGELYHRMKDIGAGLVLETLQKLKSGSINPKMQDESKVSHAPKLFHDNCQLDFSLTAEEIHNFIRGMSPFPAAWIMWKDQKIKIFRSKLSKNKHDLEAGDIDINPKSHFRIYLRDGFIDILELQMAGKRRMKIGDFLNGIHNL